MPILQVPRFNTEICEYPEPAANRVFCRVRHHPNLRVSTLANFDFAFAMRILCALIQLNTSTPGSRGPLSILFGHTEKYSLYLCNAQPSLKPFCRAYPINSPSHC